MWGYPMSPISIIMNWSGPYTFDEASELERQGVYIVYGRNRRGPEPENFKFLYCGISVRDVGTRIYEHLNDEYNHPDNEWWIGRQIFPRKKSRDILELTEWVVTYFTEPEQNWQKTQNPPSQETFLINEWFFPDADRRRINNIGIMQHISDVLCWSPDTNLVREGDLSVWEH